MIVRLQIMKDGLQPFPMYAIVQKEEVSMKKGMKRLVSCLLAVAMVLTTLGVNTKTASAEERTIQNYVYDGYEVDFNVTDAWDGAFNADVKIANTGDDEIRDWALTFEFAHEIQNLWNATVVEHTGDTYVIKNADWNANIKPGEAVAFGMTVLCDGEIAFPENFSFVTEEESVIAQSYSAEFTLYSDWGTGCNGAIILSNLTDEPIDNWQLEFDYDREIVDIANAVIVSYEQGHYVIKNAEYNADIAANSSAHISIVAGEGAAEERPENFTMQQTVVGDSPTGEDNGKEEIPDDEMDVVIEERLKGVKYKEPEAEHMQYDDASDTYYVDNQLALIVKDGVTKEQVENYAKELEASVVGYIVVTGDYQIEFDTAKSWDELHALMEKISGYDWVEEVLLQELYEIDICASPDDPAWYVSDNTQEAWMNEWDENFPAGNNWGLEAINARSAWEYEGETVKVGIIDTMFDTEHEDLKDVFVKVWENPQNIVGNYTRAYNNKVKETSGYAHGTHIAGTLAASVNNGIGISGVANNVELYGVAMKGNNLQNAEDSTRLIERKTVLCFKYAIAKLVLCECRVINISMGSECDSINKVTEMSRAFEHFLKKLLVLNYDFLIVQAAGNEEADAYYAGLLAGISDNSLREHIIIVGAVGINSPIEARYFNEDLYQTNGYIFGGYHFWSRYNYGERIDICAPGRVIYSTVPGNKYTDIAVERYDEKDKVAITYWKGTSMAAPHVSGVAAMCFSVNPNLTGPQVKEIICKSFSQYIFDYRHDYKYKLLDAKAAVELAMNTSGEKIELPEHLYGIVEGQILIRNGNGPVTNPSSSAGGFAYAYEVDMQGQRIDGKNPIVSSLDENGEYELFLPVGNYCIIAYLPGYMPMNKMIEISKDEVYYLEFSLMKNTGEESGGDVFGVIRDAVTGKTVSGVSVEVIAGLRYDRIYEGNLSVVEHSETDENGRYSFSLMPGYYVLRLSKDGYVTNYVEVVSADGIDNQDAVITTVLAEDEYRIVLTWGSAPKDLDSHLRAEKNGEFLFHIYYWNAVYYKDNELIASLDLDDTSGYGPETITVTVSIDMETKYEYYVYDYSNGGKPNTTALSYSGAKVDVYCKDRLIKTYSVPSNKVGTRWNVFEIFNGEVIDINQIK